jgi:NTP pyrophosphatase (non-canonical NTP hydrolase)
MKKDVLDINKIKEASAKFVKEREWDKFNSPKNICMALSVEVAELTEIFQWLTEKESFDICNNQKKMKDIKDELSDILSYSIRLSNLLNINLNDAFWEKFKQNEEKYPLELSKGNALKYTEFRKSNQ